MNMKQKTHRGAAKRFKKTKSGKFKANAAYHTHILTKKSHKLKRRGRKSTVVSASEAPKLRRMLPYA